MKLHGFVFVFCFFLGKVPSTKASDKTTQTSPEPIISIPGKDVTLPCRLDVPFKISQVVVEWQQTDVAHPLTVCVYRNGEELPKEKAERYRGRTNLLTNGSLMLSNVQPQDNGTYRCSVHMGDGRKKIKYSFVPLFVAEVVITVSQTSGSKILLCESRDWNPKPTVPVLNSRREILHTERNVYAESDNRYAVQAHLNVTTAKGILTENITVICRVEAAGQAKESIICVHDESKPEDVGFVIRPPWSVVTVVVVVVVVVVVLVVMLFVFNTRLCSSLRADLTTYIKNKSSTQDMELHSVDSSDALLQNDEAYTEHGDINQMWTSGASEDTASAHSLSGEGVDVSKKLAEEHFKDMEKYKCDIIDVGKQLKVHPALIAAIISRQSEAGARLGPDGYGQLDPNCFGLMQINKLYHPVKGGPFSKDHIEQGVTFLIQFMKKMKIKRPQWNEEEQLKGALACYIAGDEKVLSLPEGEKGVDRITPYRDFSNDLLARAQWFSHNGYQ